MSERAPFRYVLHPHLVLGGVIVLTGAAPLLLLAGFALARGWEALGEGGHWAAGGSAALAGAGALAMLVWQEVYGDPAVGGVRAGAGVGPLVLQSSGVAASALDAVRVEELREGPDDARWLVSAVGPDDAVLDLVELPDGTQAMRVARGLATTMEFALEVWERGREPVRIEARRVEAS